MMLVNAPGAPSPIDSLAVATHDLLLTVLARADLLGPGELQWLAYQMRRAGFGTDDETGLKVCDALVAFFEARAAEAGR